MIGNGLKRATAVISIPLRSIHAYSASAAASSVPARRLLHSSAARRSSNHEATPTNAGLYSTNTRVDSPPVKSGDMPVEPSFSLPSSPPAGQFELFYFALRGRAEAIRMVMTAGKVPFVDRSLTQWQLRKLKAAGSPTSNPSFLQAQLSSPLPFGGLPLLRGEGGINLGQTSAILQYVAELGKLMPSTPAGRARAQMIVAGAEDLFQAYWPIKLDQNRYHYHSGAFPLTPGTNEDYLSQPASHLPKPFSEYSVPRSFRREVLPRWLTYFEAQLNNSKGAGPGGDFFVENTLSYCDIVVVAHLQAVQTIEPRCLDSFPKLQALQRKVESLNEIQEYLKKRPESGL